MTVTKAMIGKNSKFSWRVDGVTTAYALVGEITNITPPPRSRDTQEATHMDSPDHAEEHIHGLIRTGDASFIIQGVYPRRAIGCYRNHRHSRCFALAGRSIGP